MRALALGLTTLLAVGLGGCAEKEPIAKSSGAAEAPVVAGDPPPPAPIAKAAETEAATLGSEGVTGAAAGQPDGDIEAKKVVGAPADAARDAKEATEEAARKIFNATRTAALKLKEAGREAVESVRRDGQPQAAAEQPDSLAAD